MNSKRMFLTPVFKFSFLILIICLSIFLLINLQACESEQRVIKIGNQSVLSGEYRSFGEDQMVSVELAASKLSPVRIGGFDYEIEVITKDDEGNPEKAFLVAQEMVDEGVAAVIGSTFDGTTEVSLPVYEGYGIPLISPFAQKNEISEEGNIFFRMVMNNKQKIENIADFIASNINPQKLILINNQEEYSIELASLISKVREVGLESRFITETLGMDDSIFVLADAQYLEGLIAVIPEPPSLAKYSQDPKAVNFWYDFNNYLSKMDDSDISIESPGTYAPYCYDSVFIIIEAMKRSNSILPEDYVDELRAISYDGIVGHIEFDSNGDRVDPLSTIFIVKDGAWVRY